MNIRVANPPARPLLIWDGGCHFCRRWIERWREMTAGAIDYETSQEIGQRFPELGPEQFEKSLILVQPDGRVISGAEAVCRSLGYRWTWRWLAWSYGHIPGLAGMMEAGYRFIARRRAIGSVATRILWGKDVRRPTYFWARRWFLRALGSVYLVAFVSLWTQIDGLVGANGILPIGELLNLVRERTGGVRLHALPTLCWFNASDAFLHFLCAGGVIASILIIFEIAPVLSLLATFVLYLSLTVAGQTFLNFQWDILLLETGFLAIFFAPSRLLPNKWWFRMGTAAAETPVNRVAFFLLKFLLFKLMLMSGVVKLTSGDSSWWDLTALDYHYWSQPLPTVFAWWADQHAAWFKHFSVAFCLGVEIIAPFLIWAPRRPRLVAAALLVFLQVVIALTGNYCFFNLLTIALCLLLIDDATLRAQSAPESPPATNWFHDFLKVMAVVVLVVTGPVNAWHILTAFKPRMEWPRPIAFLYLNAEPFRLTNAYGLFRVMTKDRREIVIEGSADGEVWKPYEFKWKPGDVNRAPGWCAPHQPRLDWQMWFAALRSVPSEPWFEEMMLGVLEGRQAVLNLLQSNPFPEAPPRYLRARSYRYRFTTAEDRGQTGAWWNRQAIGEYGPRYDWRDRRREPAP